MIDPADMLDRIMQDQRVYLLPQSDAWPTPERCDAYCMRPRCTEPMRQWLVERGEWNGYRPAIVMVAAWDDSPEARGIVVHEAAHAWPEVPEFSDEPACETVCRWQSVMFEQFCQTPHVSGQLPWEGHDHEFIRLTLHLFSRAVNAGWAMKLADLSIAGNHYGLSHALDYWVALGSEPEQMASATCAEILSTPEPKAFQLLWHNDVSRWRKKHPELELVA